MTALSHKPYLLTANFLLLLIFCTQPQSQSGNPSPQSPSQSSPGSQTVSGAQEQQGLGSDPIPVVRTTTRLVVVDVVALDEHNAPVNGLQAKDFTVLEENKPQQVRVFSFQHPTSEVATASRPKLPTNVFTNSPSYRVNSSFNVILLDTLNTRFEDMAYGHQELIRFLKKMPPDQPVAIYALETNKVRLLQDFTTDIDALISASGKFKGQNSPLLSARADNGFGGRLGGQMNDTALLVEQDRQRFRADYTLGALSYIAGTLSGYPGRKNLIWISAAFPFDVNPNFQVAGVFDHQSRDAEIAKAADALINSQVAIYPVDPRGLTAPEAFSAENGNRNNSGPALQEALSQESGVRFAEYGTMNEMAGRTGGRSFYNRNDIAVSIRQSIDDGSTYYTLGYYPENKKWDGKFRKIQVKVNRPGVKLHYRLGYYALDPQLRRETDPKKQDLTFATALNLELPVSTSVLFQASVRRGSTQPQNRIPVDFMIDPRAVSLNQSADGSQHGTVRCGFRAYSDKGKPLGLRMSSAEYNLKPETFRQLLQSGFPCQAPLDLPKGNYLLRLGVMDNRSGLIGTTNAKVTVQ